MARSLFISRDDTNSSQDDVRCSFRISRLESIGPNDCHSAGALRDFCKPGAADAHGTWKIDPATRAYGKYSLSQTVRRMSVRSTSGIFTANPALLRERQVQILNRLVDF